MAGLSGKTIFITGASRGIGREIALHCAKDGANIVITGKTSEPHPKLEGTIHSVVEEVKQAGGDALAIQLDVRDEESLAGAVQQAAEHFGGIDICINNASAIFLKPTLATPAKRFDLMWSVNARATFLTSQAAIPFLAKGNNPHILNMSPPLLMSSRWFKDHCAYTMSKYGMSMCTLGMSEELKKQGIAVNSLWPRTTIHTAAIENNFPPGIVRKCRKPAIVAEAAYAIITSPSASTTGNFYIDEQVLRDRGQTDFDQYAVDPTQNLMTDFYIE